MQATTYQEEKRDRLGSLFCPSKLIEETTKKKLLEHEKEYFRISGLHLRVL